VPVADGTEVSGYPTDIREAFETLSPEERLDLVSRKDSPLYTGELDLPGHV